LQFWVGVANPNLGEEEAVGGGDGTVRKSVGEFLSKNYYQTRSIGSQQVSDQLNISETR